jgi:hypothetical protein
MKCLLATAFLAATAATGHAGGQSGTIGVGAEYELSGLGGLSVNFDGGNFHVGGFFGYGDVANGPGYTWDVGGRFFFHLHTTAMADFGIGGGLGVASVPAGGGIGAPTRRTTDLYLEPAFQVRLFIASNVALSFTAGVSIGVADANGTVTVGGQGIGGTALGGTLAAPTAAAGVHYYFF